MRQGHPADDEWRRPGVFKCDVEDTSFLGEHLQCRLDAGGHKLFARQHPSARLETGDRVHVELPARDLAVIAGEALGPARETPAISEPV